MGKAKVVFQPSGRRGEIPKGMTVIEASRELGVHIETLCGENKRCGKCKVRIESCLSGSVSPFREEENEFIDATEKQENYRLGCCAEIHRDLIVFVPEEARAEKQIVCKAARDIHIDHNPAVKLYSVELEPPTLENPTADFERVCEALESVYGLKDISIDIYALRDLPKVLRQGQWEVTLSVWMDKEIIRVRSGKATDNFGLAIDIGTTTVAGYCCNLRTMEILNAQSMMNPQCKYGEDVMGRISYHMKNPDGLRQMSLDIIEGLNSIIEQSVRSTHAPEKKDGKTEEIDGQEFSDPYPCIGPDDIEDITIVCNTVMHHILLQLDPEKMGLAPFPPVIHSGLDIKARELGININPGAYVHVLPNEAGFVGADNVGVLISEEPHKDKEIQLIIDIGTNGELVLGNRDRLISSSCATGPALEGAQISFGMRAAPGAIERVTIDPVTHEVDYKVVGRDAWKRYSRPEEMKAKGICGSGILDLFAELYRSGVVLKSGRFNPDQSSERYRKDGHNNQPEFIVARSEETGIGKDIVITQKDIRQIQLAKGALYCGCKLMMRRLGIKTVDKVKIAGAFGTHVDREKALIMGLFPDCEIDKIVSIGNAAGDGARAALLNRDKREEANWIARHIENIELTLEDDFQQQFMEALQVPHMNDVFPNLEGLVPSEILHQE